jgi:Eukaryotic cytochrome b561
MDTLWAALGQSLSLSLSLRGQLEHSLSPHLLWHARCMVLAWGVLLPLGALAARFFKVLPSQNWPQRLDNKTWWHLHRALQYLGMLLMAVGLWWVLQHGVGAPAAQAKMDNATAARWHGWAGWAVCLIGVLQVVGAFLRGSKGGPTERELRGDHYDMTAWRQHFERWHKGLGWLALGLAVLVMGLGLWLVDAPRWMALMLALWWLLLVALFVHWQRSGRCVDTYQAIWGPDAAHPGNRPRRLAWGVRRPRS